MELFDVLNMMFRDKPKFSKLTNGDKSRNYFMINRFMAIKNPSIAMQLSFYGINPVEVVNYWSLTVGQQYSSTPKWMYVKTKKERERKKAKLPADDLVRVYCDINQIEEKVFWELYKRFQEDLEEELVEYETYTKTRT